MPRRLRVAIPEPTEDVRSLRASVMALKELAETLAGQRGDDPAVTVSDLDQRFTQLTNTTAGAVWSPLPYLNAWTDYVAPFAPSGFCKLSSGLVLLRGLVQNGTAAAICQLPAGYRPGVQLLLVAYTATAGGVCRLDVGTSGIVAHTGGSTTWISLNNVCFLAEN